MKKIIAIFTTVFVLISVFTLSASALSQNISGSAENSTATFYVTVSDKDMSSCNGSFSVAGGTITSIALAGNGTISVSGNSYTYSGSNSATIIVTCNMSGDTMTLASRDATVLDNQGRMVGVADGMFKSVAVAVAPTTTTTVKEDDTTTTTEESTTEESTTEETSTTTTTTEIVIAPTNPKPQNNNGNGSSSKLLIVMIVVAATVLLSFAVGILLGKRRSEAIMYKSGKSVEDILGEIEDNIEDSAD